MTGREWRRGCDRRSGSRGASRRVSCGAARRACSTPRHARLVREILSARRATRGISWCPMASTPRRRRSRRPRPGPIEIVHAGEIYTGRSLVPVLRAAHRLRARHPDAADSRDHLRRAAAAGVATHSRGGARAVRRRAAAHPVRRVVRAAAARARAARRGQRPHALFDSLQGVRLHGRRPAHPRPRAARARRCSTCWPTAAPGMCVEPERHRPASSARSSD